MLGRMTFAALALSGILSRAAALDTNVGTIPVTLPPPAGFCELSASNPSDQKQLTTMSDVLEKSGNRLLAMSADCQQLADWRSGKRNLLDDYAQYQTYIPTLDKPPRESVAQTCADLRAQGTKLAAESLQDMKPRMESAVANLHINQMSFVGVLAEDPEACYGGLIQKYQFGSTDRTDFRAFAYVIIKNREMYVYRSTVYENSDTSGTILAKLKADVAALIAANGK